MESVEIAERRIYFKIKIIKDGICYKSSEIIYL